MFPGPKCSACMAAISLWGIIFMAIVGGLFWNHSVGLIEDLPQMTDEKIVQCYTKDFKGKDGNGPYGSACWDYRVTQIKKHYEQNAKNCWIASGAFVVVFALTTLKFCIAIR